MDYSKLTKEELLVVIDEFSTLNKELLAEKEQEINLNYAWTGNLGHWYLNFKTCTVTFNPLKIKSMGYTMDELPEKIDYSFFTDKLHPDDYENTMNSMKNNMLGKSSVYECEYRILTKDKKYKWFYDRGKVTQRDENGNPLFASGIVFDITDKKENEQKLINYNELLLKENFTDSLTKIMNRRAIMDELQLRLKQAENYNSPLSIAMIDIDKFKNINDTKGHIAGDKVLKGVANIISNSVRGLDTVGRYGGEEFLVIFPNTNKYSAFNVCERIRKNVEEFVFDEEIHVTVSGGVTDYNKEDIFKFIESADKKLYEAKQSKRNKIIL